MSGVSSFCNRLKMAGVRLGKRLLWVQCNAYNEILVYWLEPKIVSVGLGCTEMSYKSYFYAIDENTL
jgi:hypothetical protein